MCRCYQLLHKIQSARQESTKSSQTGLNIVHISGCIGGSFSLIFVYPLDFARTRIGDIGKPQVEDNSMVDCTEILENMDSRTSFKNHIYHESNKGN